MADTLPSTLLSPKCKLLSEKCTTLTFQTLSLHTMVASLGGLFKGRKTLFLGHLWPFYRTLPFRIFPHVEIQMTIVTHMYEAHNQQSILPFISKTPWTSCNLAVKSSGLFLKFSLALIWAWAQCLKEGRSRQNFLKIYFENFGVIENP